MNPAQVTAFRPTCLDQVIETLKCPFMQVVFDPTDPATTSALEAARLHLGETIGAFEMDEIVITHENLLSTRTAIQIADAYLSKIKPLYTARTYWGMGADYSHVQDLACLRRLLAQKADAYLEVQRTLNVNCKFHLEVLELIEPFKLDLNHETLTSRFSAGQTDLFKVRVNRSEYTLSNTGFLAAVFTMLTFDSKKFKGNFESAEPGLKTLILHLFQYVTELQKKITSLKNVPIDGFPSVLKGMLTRRLKENSDFFLEKGEMLAAPAAGTKRKAEEREEEARTEEQPADSSNPNKKANTGECPPEAPLMSENSGKAVDDDNNGQGSDVSIFRTEEVRAAALASGEGDDGCGQPLDIDIQPQTCDESQILLGAASDTPKDKATEEEAKDSMENGEVLDEEGKGEERPAAAAAPVAVLTDKETKAISDMDKEEGEVGDKEEGKEADDGAPPVVVSATGPVMPDEGEETQADLDWIKESYVQEDAEEILRSKLEGKDPEIMAMVVEFSMMTKGSFLDSVIYGLEKKNEMTSTQETQNNKLYASLNLMSLNQLVDLVIVTAEDQLDVKRKEAKERENANLHPAPPPA